MSSIDINKDVFPLIDVVIAAVKDKVIIDELEKIKDSQREYMHAEANLRKKKTSEIIMAISRIDQEKILLQHVCSSLNSEVKNSVDKLIHFLDKERNDLLEEKKIVSNNHSTSRITSKSKSDNNDSINGVSLNKGDILAVTRKGGLYRHYGVYIGDNKVIHYAAENGDFSGRISIHEASLSEFQDGAMLVYVLDFPDDGELPTKRGFYGDDAKLQHYRESLFFSIIRTADYHLYSPEETVERARERMGEDKYSLPFNNCEHFAIWCKTGVKESHQVNEWITQLFDFSRANRISIY